MLTRLHLMLDANTQAMSSRNITSVQIQCHALPLYLRIVPIPAQSSTPRAIMFSVRVSQGMRVHTKTRGIRLLLAETTPRFMSSTANPFMENQGGQHCLFNMQSFAMLVLLSTSTRTAPAKRPLSSRPPVFHNTSHVGHLHPSHPITRSLPPPCRGQGQGQGRT